MIKKYFTPQNLFLLLTLIAGTLILIPFISFQNMLSQGDHGRDLYAAERILRGDAPYKDYWWCYGPLMPYYYALFMKFLGVNIQSVLIGKTLLSLVSGIFIFLTLRILWGSLAGFSGALWFFLFQRDFFYTYNHAGGIFIITAILTCIAQYLVTQKNRWIWLSLFGIFILSFVKLNFGAVTLVILVLTTLLTDRAYGIQFNTRKALFYSFIVLALPLIIFFFYWPLIHNLTSYELSQCFPYSKEYWQYQITPWQSLENLLRSIITNLQTNPIDLCFGGIVLFSGTQLLRHILLKEFNKEKTRLIFLTLSIFSVYYLLTLHEYIASGTFYQTFWAQPVTILLMFSIIAASLERASQHRAMIFWGCILVMCIIGYQNQIKMISMFYKQKQCLDIPRGNIFIRNSPAWIATVKNTVSFIQKEIDPKESFLALPYEPLYYFLTQHKSPAWLLLFVQASHPTREQEERVLHDLERNHVNWVILSSRLSSREAGMGTLGKDYCPLIADYISRNFTPVAQFGDWTNPPGWAWNHGTVILKRKASLPISQ
ncbi:MAG: hypothetical protein HQL21_02165 [Candidatus Omnitrophica bacterium]|nr:hypothetical protein [Candidatus Omnitrophota bacterium]